MYQKLNVDEIAPATSPLKIVQSEVNAKHKTNWSDLMKRTLL